MPGSVAARGRKSVEGYDWRAPFGESDAAERLPYCLRILLENCLRNQADGFASQADIDRLVQWRPGASPFAVPVRVTRVIMPDSSGLPALMDIAALRDAVARHGGDPAAVQPLSPMDLVIDHSVTVDHYGHKDAIELNVRREFERNNERYRFFKWAQKSFGKTRVVPPGTGIIHQVHLESLAEVITTEQRDGQTVIFPEFVLGGDSHTPMINGLGVLGWGVGGVEIEAAVLGEPYISAVPQVVGVRLTGALRPGVTVTDLVLTVTNRLRAHGVTGDFIEFCGPAYAALTVFDRATIANMAPEYGATAAYFPIDAMTIDYLRQTGRPAEHVALVERYARDAGFFHTGPEPAFSAVVELDLGTVEASLAGPKRPQDRVPLASAGSSFREALHRTVKEGGYERPELEAGRRSTITLGGVPFGFGDGSLAIAAITACTSTSNPSAMLAAGLLARKAVEAGLTVPPFVKTSMAPGSKVVTRYLEELGLLPFLETLGFFVVGYGCTTCSGKSGALVPEVAEAIERDGLIAAAVTSSNRNFEGRIHRQLRAAYLASPPLVVAFAIAGRIDLDLTREPLGHAHDGRPVFLADIWPEAAEIDRLRVQAGRPELYRDIYASMSAGTYQWNELDAPDTLQFRWDPTSTYILRPPFFDDDRLAGCAGVPDSIQGARALGVYADSLTTDHIAPAGEIPLDSPAGAFLREHGVTQTNFNAYTMRRGNHHVLTRAIYAHARIRNLLAPERDGGFTLKMPERRVETVFDAAAAYRMEGTPLIVLVGRDYGMGSSRDWAAKGPALLGVRAVIAQSFERIHRSNLVALGLLPLEFAAGESVVSLGLDGTERFDVDGLADAVAHDSPVRVQARRDDGTTVFFRVRVVLISDVERRTIREGGIFRRVFARFCSAQALHSVTAS